MIFFDSDSIVDTDLSLVLSVARLLDEKMDAVIEQASSVSGHLDSPAVLDELEHLLGFGIVGFQTYITASLSRTKIQFRLPRGKVISPRNCAPPISKAVVRQGMNNSPGVPSGFIKPHFGSKGSGQKAASAP